jgi:transposase InsO family protein
MRLCYIKPRCLEQNGKVERSHRVDEEEFRSRSTFESFTPAAEAFLVWERRYNHERFSMALRDLTPAENSLRSRPPHLRFHQVLRDGRSRDGTPSRELEDCAYQRCVQLDFIRPGKPVGNAFIESCNGRLRDECLNVHQFASLAEAQAIIEAWRMDSNTNCPHRSLGHLTSSKFVTQRQEEQDAEDARCSR